MMTRIHKEQDGWVLLIAMVVMVLMLGIGLAALSITDTQSQQSRKERERDASLNLAEGVLYSQSFILSLPPPSSGGATEGWPGALTRAYPTNGCTQATAGAQCPDDSTLANVAQTLNSPASFQSVDVNAATIWKATIQDNGTTADDNDYGHATSTHWDANKDGKLWVRAEATVRGHKRIVVGLMQLEQIPVNFPRVALTAGSFTIHPSGQGPYIDTGGTGVQVRCTGNPSTACADYTKPGQVSPSAPGSITTGLVKPKILDPTTLASLKQTAIDNGTYFASVNGADNCPTGAQLTGKVVYVEKCSRIYGATDLTTDCNFDGTAYKNCANGGVQGIKAGTLVWEKGVLAFNGNVTFVGVIYHLNLDSCGPETPTVTDGPTCPAPVNGQSVVVSVDGGASIVGALNIDGGGGVNLGSNGINLFYDANVFNDITTNGTTGLVQNTWRELDG